MGKKIIVGLLFLLVFIQFFRIDQSNPEVNPETNLVMVVHAPPESQQLLRTACYDCHSFETVYPWYANVAPVSWWIKFFG